MRVDPRIVEFIKNIREQYGRIGKDKIAVLLVEYCKELGIDTIQPTTNNHRKNH